MENKKIEFPTGRNNLMNITIDEVNSNYQTNFKLLNIKDEDGVTFAVIDIGESNSEMVFTLGYIYGMKCENERLQDPEYAEIIKNASSSR